MGKIMRKIMATLKDPNDELLALIQKLMVHTPCGGQNPRAVCMVNGKCSKGFPKPFREETSITEDSYACTKRSNTGQTYMVRGKQVDNQWVVCHNKYLIWKYRCHINIESVASVKAVKYIYKYVYKGHDCYAQVWYVSVGTLTVWIGIRYKMGSTILGPL